MDSLFSVTTAASDTSLLTISELRSAVGVSDESRDAELTILGRRISASIARACGVATGGTTVPTLMRETCTEVFRLSRSAKNLILSRRPVTSITSVVWDGDTLDADEYEVSAATGILTRLCDDDPISWSCGKITVVYVAGFSTVPDDLKLAATKLVTSVASESTRDPNLKREFIPGVIENEYWVAPTDDPLLSSEIEDLIAPYRQRYL